MNCQNDQIYWLDIAKGIAIILMVIGHTPIPEKISHFIFAFHMPLFFIASGWSSNYIKYPFGQYVQKKWKSLMVPFFCYSAVVILLMHCIGVLYLNNLFIHGWGGYALWFVPVLFLASIVVRASYCVSSMWSKGIIMLGLLMTAYCLRSFGVSLPWQLSTIPYASFLIMLGHEMARSRRLIEASSHYWDVILLAVLTFIISSIWQLDMAWNQITPIIPLTIGAVAGTLMTFRLSVWIERNVKWCSHLLQRVGKETYIVVAFSQIIIMYINHFVLMNPALKYLTLVVTLILLKHVKDGIINIYKRKRIFQS